jgi:dipeptidase E
VKLYLSSVNLGAHAGRLTAMAGGPGARMAVITNALDYIPIDAQIDYARAHNDAVSYFAEAGFDPSPLDLRLYFGRPAALRRLLLRHRVIWAVGGNAFLLRRAMRESGFDAMIGELLAKDDMVYAGWSAGACVAGADLRPIALMDDPKAIAPGYPPQEPLQEGLSLVPFTIIPHYRSNHGEAEAAESAVAWAEAQGIGHVPLSDGDVVVVDGGEPEVLRGS